MDEGDDPFQRAASASLSASKAFGRFLWALLVALWAAVWAVLWSTGRLTSSAARGLANSFGWSWTALPDYSEEPRGLYPGQALEDVEAGIVSDSLPSGCSAGADLHSAESAPSGPAEAASAQLDERKDSPAPLQVVMQLPTPQRRLREKASSSEEQAALLDDDAAGVPEVVSAEDTTLTAELADASERERIASEEHLAAWRCMVSKKNALEESMQHTLLDQRRQQRWLAAEAAAHATEEECVAEEKKAEEERLAEERLAAEEATAKAVERKHVAVEKDDKEDEERRAAADAEGQKAKELQQAAVAEEELVPAGTRAGEEGVVAEAAVKVVEEKSILAVQRAFEERLTAEAAAKAAKEQDLPLAPAEDTDDEELMMARGLDEETPPRIVEPCLAPPEEVPLEEYHEQQALQLAPAEEVDDDELMVAGELDEELPPCFAEPHLAPPEEELLVEECHEQQEELLQAQARCSTLPFRAAPGSLAPGSLAAAALAFSPALQPGLAAAGHSRQLGLRAEAHPISTTVSPQQSQPASPRSGASSSELGSMAASLAATVISSSGPSLVGSLQSSPAPSPPISPRMQRQVCSCGNHLMFDANYCRKCGKKVEANKDMPHRSGSRNAERTTTNSAAPRRRTPQRQLTPRTAAACPPSAAASAAPRRHSAVSAPKEAGEIRRAAARRQSDGFLASSSHKASEGRDALRSSRKPARLAETAAKSKCSTTVAATTFSHGGTSTRHAQPPAATQAHPRWRC
mmetsp:Transcript_122066/g.222064  ORF Transcript_122066/g.222064 Transcript_122066/m.222064 type:complete len:747 (-) Transcript_122066:123-2363(-)